MQARRSGTEPIRPGSLKRLFSVLVVQITRFLILNLGTCSIHITKPLGARHPRPQRGLLTRPDCETVGAYRTHIDEAMATLIIEADEHAWSSFAHINYTRIAP